MLLVGVLLVAGRLFASPQTAPSPLLPPILQIFEPKVQGANLTQLSYDAHAPLLVIRKLKRVQLARDGKGILLILTDEDAKRFLKITSDFNGLPLIFRTAGGVERPITINGAVADGHLGFRYPEAAPLADDLRQALGAVIDPEDKIKLDLSDF